MVEQAIRIGLEEKVDVGRSIIYGLQHMVAMFAGVVAAPLIGGAVAILLNEMLPGKEE